MPSKKTNTYDEFIDKFRVKKTTDDCYTPDNIYEVVADYVADTYKLDKANFVRPFYPGGDYEHYDYQDGDVVVDNPPFSIMAKILRFYTEKNIPFFLFTNALTIFNAASSSCMCICCGVTIEYENTAKVCTSFITNLEPAGVKSDPKLYRAIEEANKINTRKMHSSLPKYTYPSNVLMASDVIRLSKYGIDFKVTSNNIRRISKLDSQVSSGKGLFGGGLLVNNAAAKAAAKAKEAVKAEAKSSAKDITWTLSDRELALIDEMDSSAGVSVIDEDANRFEVL